MQRGLKPLAFIVAAIAMLTTGLLILLFVPRLGWVGFHERGAGHCPCCAGTGVLDPWGFLATVAIVLMMVSIPVSHIVVLVLAMMWVGRWDRAPRVVRHDQHAEESD
jgi:hypothetical protein